jgi:hypothetical protein
LDVAEGVKINCCAFRPGLSCESARPHLISLFVRLLTRVAWMSCGDAMGKVKIADIGSGRVIGCLKQVRSLQLSLCICSTHQPLSSPAHRFL